MQIKIALAGNPNSGKTTMFNALTGSAQHVGNWPGVTVEKKEGTLCGNKDIVIQDLPGIYSLSPYTPEELVSRQYLVNDKPDVIIDIVDATNIERNLYLTTQLKELGIPMVIALNMMDVVKKNGDTVDVAKLEKLMGCKVVETSALKGSGTKMLIDEAIAVSEQNVTPLPQDFYSEAVQSALNKIEAIIKGSVPEKNLRWYAVKLFERDEKIVDEMKLDTSASTFIEEIISEAESKKADDSVSIIINERYDYISKVTKQCFKKKSRDNKTMSDRIDTVITNRWLALPIFAVVMFAVYYLSVSTIGTMMTDWVNDVLFGEIILPNTADFLSGIGCADWLSSLVVDGIIGGVGSVLGFLPQLIVLFICLALLEDCGYMSRIAFIMDKLFRKFGLSGKSFIPMLISTGCGVPGIMATRTIANERDRRITIMTTTFVPCSAKLPVIALISSSLFQSSAWVAVSVYFVGIAAIVTSGIILKKTKKFAGEPAPFVMELPAYHMPNVKGVYLSVANKSKAFVKKAGTIILLCSMLIWFLRSFNFRFEMVEMSDSMLAAIGSFIAPLFSPLGWGNWKATVASFTGLLAKENIVSTIGVLYGFAEVSEDGAEIWSLVAADFTAMSAYSFLIFNMLCAPCVAAIGAIKREMGDMKHTLMTVGFQTGLAYAAALCIYQIGNFFKNGIFTVGTGAAVAFAVIFVYLLFRKNPMTKQVKSDKKEKVMR